MQADTSDLGSSAVQSVLVSAHVRCLLPHLGEAGHPDARGRPCTEELQLLMVLLLPDELADQLVVQVLLSEIGSDVLLMGHRMCSIAVGHLVGLPLARLAQLVPQDLI